MSEPTTAEICDCANTGPAAINTCQRVIRGRVEPPCDCDCHKPTREQKCRDLAMAMGIPESEWQYKCLAEGHSLDEDVWCYSCCKSVNESPRIPPNPYASHAACHDLVVWLATQQRHIQQRFVFAVRDETTDVDLCYELRILTADPAIKAEAVWRSITATEQPKAS
jgi:hypothetical protein